MEEEKKLYPMRFVPIEQGSHSLQLADLGWADSEIRNGYLAADSISDVMDTYMDRVVGDDVFAWYGRQFPLLVSTLRGDVPLSVCPPDELASQRWDLLGKSKLWYVVSAAPDARIGIGFARDVSATELYEACVGGTARTLLNVFRPEVGYAYLIPPGTVHCSSGKTTILEIAESSPLDFLLEDDGEQELTLAEALDFISYGPHRFPEAFPAKDGITPLAREEQFSVSEIKLRDPLQINSGGTFSLYSCVCGSARIQYPDHGETFSEGETILVPSELEKFVLLPLA